MTRVALASCAALPDLDDEGQLLAAALRDRGAEVDTPVWDDPAVAWEGYDAVVVRGTWDYVPKLERFLAWTDHVAGVDDLEVLQPVGAQREARPRPVVGEVVGHPDRLRPEAGARPVRRPAVEGRPHHDDVRTGVRRLVVEVARRHAQEGDVGTELSAVASHGPTLERALQ